MAKRSKKKTNTDKAFNSLVTLLGLVFLLYLIATVMTSCEESQTLKDISSGKGVNMPPLEGIVSARQKDFTQGMIEDIARAGKLFAEVKAMPTASDAEKARKSRAADAIYEPRRKLWADLTTPLQFNGFTGVITDIRTGSGSFARERLDIKVQLFGSRVVLKMTQYLDENNEIFGDTAENGNWKIVEEFGESMKWFDLNEGDAVAVNGSFFRYSEKKKWAHCCVSNSSWPKFVVKADKITRLKAPA